MAQVDTTALQYWHRRAPGFFALHEEDFFLNFIYFLHWKEIEKSGAISGWPDPGLTTNVKLPFFHYK